MRDIRPKKFAWSTNLFSICITLEFLNYIIRKTLNLLSWKLILKNVTIATNVCLFFHKNVMDPNCSFLFLKYLFY